MKPRGSIPGGVPRLPDPTGLDFQDPEAVRTFLVSLTSTLATQLQRRPPVGTSQDKRMFTAPDGRIWTLSIAADGTVVTEPIGSTQGSVVPPV